MQTKILFSNYLGWTFLGDISVTHMVFKGIQDCYTFEYSAEYSSIQILKYSGTQILKN